MEVSRRTGEFATSAVTGLLGVLVCYGALENGISWDSSGPQPGFFPFYVGCLIVLGSAATGVQALLHRAGKQPPFLDAARGRAAALFLVPIIAFAALSAWLGLYIGMAFYVLYAMRVPGRLKLTTSAAIAATVVAVNFVVFEKLFMVPLLKGPVLNHFGIH